MRFISKAKAIAKRRLEYSRSHSALMAMGPALVPGGMEHCACASPVKLRSSSTLKLQYPLTLFHPGPIRRTQHKCINMIAQCRRAWTVKAAWALDPWDVVPNSAENACAQIPHAPLPQL